MLKNVLKSILQLTPYRVTLARDANRFQAINECLISLANRGFKPRKIIDGGANVGEFTQQAASIFPYATFHLVEPQPACASALSQLARGHRFHIHPVALGSGDGFIELAIDPTGVSTGAHILPEANQSTHGARVQVQIARLDSLFASEIVGEDRCLLKLDLQGWELEALKGANQMLKSIEVILCEVSFFAQAYEPSIEALVQFLETRGYALYDIASIAARQRDNRAHQGDFVFVRRNSPLMIDTAWS